MIFSSLAFPLFISLLLAGCHTPEQKVEQTDSGMSIAEEVSPDPIIEEPDTLIPAEVENTYASTPDTAFVVMSKYAPGFAYDMKYAADDNFLKEAVYTCDQCLIRKEVADALKKANDSLLSLGLRIKFYDCYRPLDIQKQMWKIYPNAKYVANPYTTGSVHNKGGAVDITLVNLEGQELDMGTTFDHFGREAHHAYTNLPDTVLANRRLLKAVMEANRFNAITSEWWHYSIKSSGRYTVSNFSVECD